MIGEHQVENVVVALKTFSLIAKRDGFMINEKKMNDVLLKLSFLGRMDIITINNKQIILDGAHNVQKMNSLIKTLQKIYPNQKSVFLLAFKNGKDYQQMIKKIIPLASEIILTQFGSLSQDLPHKSQDLNNMAEFLKKNHFTKVFQFQKSKDALEFCLQKKENIVVTGSLYFMAEIYTLLDN